MLAPLFFFLANISGLHVVEMQVVVVVVGMLLMMLAGELLSLLRLACGMGHIPLLRRQLALAP